VLVVLEVVVVLIIVVMLLVVLGLLDKVVMEGNALKEVLGLVAVVVVLVL
jgi:hypothetical protein